MTEGRTRFVFQVARGALRAVAATLLALARGARVVLGLRPLRSAARVVVLAGALGLAAIAVDATCFLAVPHGFVGVKQFDVGDKGIEEADHPPGLVRRLPFLESSHLVDARLQVLRFGREAGGAPWLEVRTREGDVVQVAARVVYRVRPGEAWELVQRGLKGAWRQRMQTTAEAAIPRELGRLSAVELTTSEARIAGAERLREELDRTMGAEHVEVVAVLVTEVQFGPEYEKKLQARQLAVQQESLRKAAAEAEALRAQTELAEQEIETSTRAITAQWDVRIAERAAAGKSEIAAIRRDSSFYASTRRAAGTAERDRLVLEGERTMAKAAALKESLMRKALAGNGGRYWLARRAAETLNIRQVTLDPSDPGVPSVLDLDQMVRLLVGTPPSSPR